MKLIIAACLLVLTITSTECKQDKRQFEENICFDATDATTEIFACIADFSSGSSLACEENCRTLLDEYADECLFEGADLFKTNVENLCNAEVNPTLSTSDLCMDVSDPNSELAVCLLAFGQLSSTACEEECRSVLQDYADECLGTSADPYIDELNNFCETVVDVTDEPTEDDATTIAATLFSTFTAVLVAFASFLN